MNALKERAHPLDISNTHPKEVDFLTAVLDDNSPQVELSTEMHPAGHIIFVLHFDFNQEELAELLEGDESSKASLEVTVKNEMKKCGWPDSVSKVTKYCTLCH